LIKILLLIVAAFLSPTIYIIVKSSPIDSVAWLPPTPPALIDEYAPNDELKKSELLALGQIYGPEDVAIDKAGVVYGGTQDGKIVKVFPDGKVETWVETGGRPLGLHFDASENLIVCDAYKGLLSIDKNANVKLLTDFADGGPFVFTDDLDIASDGKIYFTDASSKWNQSQYTLDLLEAKPYGRFMVYDPLTQTTTVLLKDMYFPNGVAMSMNEDFVLVNETWRYRVMRYWLKGEKAGTTDTFIDNLPGFPDGISSNREGRFWLALPTPRNSNVDMMYSRPWLKNFIAKLPKSLQPKPVEHGYVLGLNEQGVVEVNLQDPSGELLKEISSVQEHNGYIYLGALYNDRIGRYKL